MAGAAPSALSRPEHWRTFASADLADLGLLGLTHLVLPLSCIGKMSEPCHLLSFDTCKVFQHSWVPRVQWSGLLGWFELSVGKLRTVLGCKSALCCFSVVNSLLPTSKALNSKSNT